jgi:hypothetical protein
MAIAVPLLGRASTDYPAAAELLSRVAPVIVGGLADLDASEQVPEATVNVIPYPSVVLAPALSLTRRIIGMLPADIQPAQRVVWLLRLGGWLRESDIQPMLHAPTRKQPPSSAGPAKEPQHSGYLADLASILRNLGVLYADLGRHADAVRLSEEAVQVLRRVAGMLSDRSGLAASAMPPSRGIPAAANGSQAWPWLRASRSRAPDSMSQ